MSFSAASGTASISVILNFGPGTTLAPFVSDGVQLNAADVFFTVGGEIEYGIALTSHANGITAGSLYQVSTSAGVMSAYDVLHLGSGFVYRPEFPVWLRDDGRGSIQQVGGGTVTTAVTGDGYTSGRLTASVTFTPTPEFVALLLEGSMGVELASATCGNDIKIVRGISLTPDRSDLPEPSSWVLGATGLLGLAVYRKRWDSVFTFSRRQARLTGRFCRFRSRTRWPG